VNIVCSFLLIKPLAIGGLALASSLASAFNFALLVWILRKRLGRLHPRKTIDSVRRKGVAATLVGIVAWAFLRLRLWPPDVDTNGTIFERGVRVLGGVVLGMFTYLLVLVVLRSKELYFFLEMIRRKSPKIPT